MSWLLIAIGVVVVIDASVGRNRSVVAAACGLFLVLFGAAFEIAERAGWLP